MFRSKNDDSIPRIAAFFDFDKTLLATDCLSKEAFSLWNISWEKKNYVLFIKIYFIFTVIVPLYHAGLVSGSGINRIYIWLVYRGMRIQKLQEHGQQLYLSQLRKQLYPQMIQLMKDHRAKGHIIIVVSASPHHLLQPFFQEYTSSIHHMETTHVQINETTGRCTGHCSVCIGPQKARAQQRFADALGIDLQRSFAYSDHHHDLEFLECVGTAIVVNPTPELDNMAKKREWTKLELRLIHKHYGETPADPI